MNENNKMEITTEAENQILKLDNQLCFAFYVCSKEIIKKYRPFLEPLGLTYTAYIAMLALWEEDNITVKALGSRLYLDSGTLTPLLKKLENQSYITRFRSKENERNVYICLTDTGRSIKKQAAKIPLALLDSVGCGIANSAHILKQLHNIMEMVSTEKSL